MSKDTKCCDGYPYCYCDEMASELEDDMIVHQDKVDVSINHNNIINPIHYNDVPETKEEIDRMWDITRNLCK